MTKKLLKGKIQAGVQNRVDDFWKEKIGRYVMQGDFLALLVEEENCVTWKSYLWDIPQGVLKFAINASINTLPTLDNLKRWGKRVNDRCPFCGNIQTLAHVLTGCVTALNQGRYTFRHDSVLSTIVHFVGGRLRPGFALFSDLAGFQAPHGGTIPPHVISTSFRPDIFVLNESRREVVIFELTCPWDRNVERSHTFKEDKYAPLAADLSGNYRVFHFSVEVSARGQISKQNRARLRSFVYTCCTRDRQIGGLIVNCSRASLLSSFTIFHARGEPSWNSPGPLTVRTGS